MATQRSAYAVGAPPAIFAQSKQTALGLINQLALIDRVPLRLRIGLNLLRKSYLIGMTLFMLLVSWIGNLHVSLSMFGGIGVRSDDDTSLRNYALFVFLPLGIWQHVQRLREEKRGTEPHTYWGGDGWWYSFMPLPDKYVDMLVDPLVGFIVGGLMRYRLGCGLLGLWVMVSAVCLFLVEKIRYTQALEHRRDRNDITMEAEWDAGFLRNRPNGGSGRNSGGTAASIPTGNDEGLLAQIEKRKLENEWAEKTNPGVDNGNAF
jgi:hypothetical protein